MQLTLKVYEDDNGFYYEGIYNTLFSENIEILDYANKSFVRGVYEGGETVDFGDILPEGDPRAQRLLAIRNILSGRIVWVKETKEQIMNEINKANNTQPVINIVNNINGGGTSGGVGNFKLFQNPTEGNTTAVTGIGRARDLTIEKSGNLYGEWKDFAAFDEEDLPVGRFFKIDPANDLIYWGDGAGAGEWIYIKSDVHLELPA